MRFDRSRPPQRWFAAVALLVAFTALSASAALAEPRITCALPLLRAQPGADCVGVHQVLVGVPAGFSGTPTVTAELIAYDLDGNVLATLPVASGDQALLASRISPTDFKVGTKRKQHEMFAPVPVFRVTAFDPVTQEKAQAFCSNIPYLDVMQPNGTVVSASESDVVKVFAAIPRVDAGQVQLRVDGQNIFPLIGKSPDECTAAAPCCTAPSGCPVSVNGDDVTIFNVVVDSAPDLHIGSSNTASFEVSGLECGGHAFVVTGDRSPSFRVPGSAQCNLDDLTDRGVASIFAINVTSPTPGQTGVAVPTTVTGEVCGGEEIASVDINGQAVSIAGQVVIPGDGVDTADSVKLTFSTQLGQTNLAQDINTGDAPLGTFDAGTNRVLASARDVLGNRTYDNVLFSTGLTLNPGVSPLALQSLETFTIQSFGDHAAQQIQGMMLNIQSVVEVDNAFVVGLSPNAIQQQLNQRCLDPVNGVGKKYKDAVTQMLNAKTFAQVNIDPGPCAPSVNVTPQITNIQIDENQVSCPVVFENGKIAATINLPDVKVTIRAQGYECTGCDVVCLADTTVDFTSVITVKDSKVTFDITENQLLPTTASPPPTVFVEGTSTNDNTGGVSVGCIAGVCNFFISLATFGIVNIPNSFTVDISNDTDFQQQLGASKPDPIALNEIKVDEQVVSNFDQQLGGTVTTVKITPAGLVAGLKGTFATTVIDPNVAETPGALLTPAPVPTLPVAGAEDAFMALSDDALNMLFASMTLAGRLQTTCEPSGKTVADLLPPDCESLTGETAAATLLLQATCHAVKGDDSCETLTAPTGLGTAIKQGICHGVRGDDCTTIPVSSTTLLANTERNTCAEIPALNISGDQNILFCTKQDIPPRVLLLGGGGTSPVQTALRLNDLSVGLVIDRSGDGFDFADIADTPPCFGTGAAATGDCRLYALCLDLNLNFNMAFQTCEDGKPGIATQFQNVQILDRQAGVVCDGSGAAGSDSEMLSAAANDDTVIPQLGNQAEQFSPPLCMKGLDLEGIVNCADPRLILIDTDGAATFKDYLGVTCPVTP